ncbi:MAG: hypothetical protein BMS9Abin37_0463 [Acidobacteriota bacterium]|nr:MAG: hypothetical protein BMS9Abin37_0463 [Acidobacteriota bacterium]
MKKVLSNSLVFLALPISLFAQASVDIGDRAPDFELHDSTGTTYKLSDYQGEKVVVLEFFRSGDW